MSTDVAEKPATNPMYGFTVHRTLRDTWHVINRFTGDHWESPNQATVEASVLEYNTNTAKREAERAAAEEARKNPQAAEFGTEIPGESMAFEHFLVTNAGKANAPTLADDAPGAIAEPDEVVPLAAPSDEQIAAYLQRQADEGNAAGAEPAPVSRVN